MSTVIEAGMERFKKQYRGIEADLLELLQQYIDEGLTVEEATRRAFTESQFKVRLQSAVLDNVVTTAALTINLSDNFPQWYTNKSWSGQKYNLSQKTLRLRNRSERLVVKTLKDSIKKGDAWTKVAQDLSKVKVSGKTAVKGELKKGFKRLLELTDRQTLTTRQKREYKRLIRGVQADINKLSERQVISQRLKKAQQNLLDKIQKGKKEAIDKAVERAVKAKTRYQSARIARTELQFADTAARQKEIDTDKEVIGYKSVLSDNRPAKFNDMCDFHAQADLYGMGEGVYPKSVPIMKPYHPNCMCGIRKVYQGEVGEYSPDAGAEWVKNNPIKAGRATLKRNKQKLKENPNDWKRYIIGVKDPRKVSKITLPDKVVDNG